MGLRCAACRVGLGLPAARDAVAAGMLWSGVAGSVVGVAQVPHVVGCDESSAAWASHGACGYGWLEFASCLLMVCVVSAG